MGGAVLEWGIQSSVIIALLRFAFTRSVMIEDKNHTVCISLDLRVSRVRASASVYI